MKWATISRLFKYLETEYRKMWRLGKSFFFVLGIMPLYGAYIGLQQPGEQWSRFTAGFAAGLIVSAVLGCFVIFTAYIARKFRRGD